MLDSYPEATLHIIKRPGLDDFDGRSLQSKLSRLKVSGFNGLDALERSLHAKIYLFEGKSDERESFDHWEFSYRRVDACETVRQR